MNDVARSAGRRGGRQAPRFLILGPLEVWADGQLVALGGPKPRVLIAMLLLHANEVVTSQQLIDELWGERPPASAAKLIQGYVSILRKVLGADALVTRGSGYVLRVGEGDLDALEFERAVAEAAGRTSEESADAFRAALQLWRGRALSDVPLQGLARHEAARLDERRLDVLSARIDADLSCGRHWELAGELEALVAEHPLRERFRGQLMLALYRSGRQADALAVYRDGRRLFMDELGIDLSPDLQDLERAILNQDPALAHTRPEALPGGTITFLFADVEGSTRLLHELGAHAYAETLELYRRQMRDAAAAHTGIEIDTQGDAFFFAFMRASDAVATAVEAQEGLAAGPVRARVGLHTGEPTVTAEGYIGLDVHRAARVCSASHGGQILLSEATRRLVENDVVDLGEHRLKDLPEPVRLFQLGEGDFPPPTSLGPTTLPAQPTPFLGRERELAQAVTLLRRDSVRLLSLTGPGGSGKTRLALQAAAETAPDYADGVFWVPLQTLQDPDLVEPAIAHAVGAKHDLAAHVGSRKVLLILDNFEHVAEAAPRLGELLIACPRVDALVTSRVSLRLAAEHEFPVPPLREEEAVVFFRSRAPTAARRGNGELREICRRLDCLPLALELAAARLKVLDPAALLERLERRLPLLTGGPRDAPARQRTLRATLDWSYDLLTEPGRRLVSRLAVFAGGCTMEAAEAVCEADLDTLQAVVEQSMLKREGDRFAMLETIREYALERLDESEDAADLRDGHALYYLSLVEDLRAAGRDSRMTYHGIREALYLERANTLAALEHFHRERAREEEARLAAQLPWIDVSHREGARWLDRVLTYEDLSEPARGRALEAAALLAGYRRDFARAAELYTEWLDRYRAHGDRGSILDALGQLAFVSLVEGDYTRARLLLREAEPFAAEVGLDQAHAHLEQLEAHVELYEGRFERAEALFERALARYRKAGDLHGLQLTLANLGTVALARGRTEDATSLYRESVAVLEEVRPVWTADTGTEEMTLLGIAATAAAREQPIVAAHLLAAADAARDAREGTHEPFEEGMRERTVTSIQQALDKETLDEALARGRELTIEAAVEYALAHLD